MCICSYYSCATSVKVLVRSEWTLQLDGIIFVNFYIIILVSHIKYTVQDLIEIISRVCGHHDRPNLFYLGHISFLANQIY